MPCRKHRQLVLAKPILSELAGGEGLCQQVDPRRESALHFRYDLSKLCCTKLNDPSEAWLW